MPQLAQPRPGLLGTLRGITMEGHQPRDQHGVLVIAYPGCSPRPPAPDPPASDHTHQRHTPLVGKLIEHHPAMPRWLTPHRHISKTTPLGCAARPVQHRTQIPRPSLDRLAGQHLRIVVADHHRLLLVGQINTHNRMIGPNQPRATQPAWRCGACHHATDHYSYSRRPPRCHWD